MFVVRNVKFSTEEKRKEKIKELKKNAIPNMEKIWDEIDIPGKPPSYKQTVNLEFVVLPDFSKKKKKPLFTKIAKELGERFKSRTSPWSQEIDFEQRLQLSFFPKRAEKVCDDLDQHKELNLDSINDLILAEKCKKIEREIRKSIEPFWEEIEQKAREETPNFRLKVEFFFDNIFHELISRMKDYDFEGKGEIISSFCDKFHRKTRKYSHMAAEILSDKLLNELREEIKTINTESFENIKTYLDEKILLNVQKYGGIIQSNIPLEDQNKKEAEYTRKAFLLKDNFFKKKSENIIVFEFEEILNQAKKEVREKNISLKADDIEYFGLKILQLRFIAMSNILL